MTASTAPPWPLESLAKRFPLCNGSIPSRTAAVHLFVPAHSRRVQQRPRRMQTPHPASAPSAGPCSCFAGSDGSCPQAIVHPPELTVASCPNFGTRPVYHSSRRTCRNDSCHANPPSATTTFTGNKSIVDSSHGRQRSRSSRLGMLSGGAQCTAAVIAQSTSRKPSRDRSHAAGWQSPPCEAPDTTTRRKHHR